MLDPTKIDLSQFDLSLLPPSLLGRLAFDHADPVKPPLPPGCHALGLADERDTMLIVPEGLAPGKPVPLLVMFHGTNGSAERVLPFLEPHARKHGFLLLLPQSTFYTWDLSIGGNGPDLERLDRALAEVASHFALDTERIGFAGFSDGASYALSIGLTNGHLLSHVAAFSAGYMNLYQPSGMPRVFIAHSPEDEQLPLEASQRKHLHKLQAAGYDLDYVEFSGRHTLHAQVVEQGIDFFMNTQPQPGWRTSKPGKIVP